MKCRRCQHENPPQAKFYLECAAPLAPRCANCGTQLPAGAKFCYTRNISPNASFLGDGLLTAEGDLWLRQRRLMQPASHRKQVARVRRTMVAPRRALRRPLAR
jgi:Double zinc ribbon